MESSRYEAQLKTLMRLAFILDAAAEGVLGKGAPAMMYQSGRDAGCSRGNAVARTDDFEEALSAALADGDDVWRFERWKEPGQEEYWVTGDGRRSTWVVFRRCPLASLGRTVGTNPGGLLCQALHGYVAGSMECALGGRVDMKIAHCGPRACKVLVEMRV